MLAKLLPLFLLTLVLFFLWRNQRRKTQSPAIRQNMASSHSVQQPRGAKRLLAVLVASLLLLITLGWMFFAWQDRFTLLEVSITNPATGDTETYQVYKGHLRGNQFTTLDGNTVRVASNERMQVRAARSSQDSIEE